MDKKELILESIIKEYIKNNKPVGSAQLQMKLSFDISAQPLESILKSLLMKVF